MKIIFSIIIFLFLSLYNSVINKEFIDNFLTNQAPYHDSHGAEKNYLGAGLIYYAIVYANKSKICVCIGSGGGFVPRIMRQAQRDLNLKDSRTILIDGNTGPYGRPLWLNKNSFFKQNFSDIEIIISLSHEASIKLGAKNLKIDYLHIDGDHSEKGCLQDFYDYLPMMNNNSLITIHDTGTNLGPMKVVEKIKQNKFEIINLPWLGAGFALVKIKK